ncbi:hypothetical protein ELQ35_07025 [Peribacillus cavernae]|uniref:Uncharacterized protein n=1 Tax=Peribacillus cavernae TaxID=1674310 RepID=A0A433HP53_9BACI|nr:hypothetical protein [Peribacillus cavernae]MDQ0217458.1 hypothetical protein [Peribacillus cavernae]RUQ30098.1 hypothetical protein ELQ35_07025 [Peribacillus cavernae]
MSDKHFDMEESQRKLMELLVSRTLRKHGVKNGKTSDLSDKEKNNLKSTIDFLQKQSEEFFGKTNKITEDDVNPLTNVYEGNDDELVESPEKTTHINKLNLAIKRKNRRLE